VFFMTKNRPALDGLSLLDRELPPKLRSKIASGSSLLPSHDGRSAWTRLMRDTYRALVAHCGGSATISDPQRIVARRIAVLEAELTFMEDGFATAREAGHTPEPSLLALYGTLADRQRRLSEPLGWQRTARDVTDKAEPTEWIIVGPKPLEDAEGHSGPSETE
jgi:hypothetical protein